MAFIRCKKHPDIVMHRELDGERSDFVGAPVYLPGLRCWVCQEIRPLKKEIQALRVKASTVLQYDDPGEGVCDACTVHLAEGKVELFNWRLHLCRSCTGVVRTKMKTLFKAMEKRAVAMNLKRGVTR